MRIVFMTPYPPSRAHARSLGFIVELARRHMVTAIALCQTAGDGAALRHLRTLGVETIAIPGAAASGAATQDPLARARMALKRIVARGDVGMIQIEGTRLGAVAQGLHVPVIWDVVGEADVVRQLAPSAGPSERDHILRPTTGATQPVRAVGPAEPRDAHSPNDGVASALLGQYASVIVGAERDAIMLLGARRALAAPLSARGADLGALLAPTAPLAQEDDIALRSFPLLRRRNSQRSGKERPATPPSPFSAHAPQTHSVGVSVIPEAIDLAYYTPQPQERERMGLVVCGDLADDATIQGIAWLLREVAPRIWRISPQVNLTIVGRGGSALPPDAFEDVHAQLHDERVRLVEGVDDIRAIVRQAALVIVPTLDSPGAQAPRTHESALEAMALGTPVVVTPTALNGLMAVPGRDLLVATSADRLATLTLRVLGDDELWGMLARHGRAYVARRHSWRLANQRVARLYARVLGYPPAGETDVMDAMGATGALDTMAAGDETLERLATDTESSAAPQSAFTDTVSVMSMLGLVGLATHPLAGAPSSGRLAPRWR